MSILSWALASLFLLILHANAAPSDVPSAASFYIQSIPYINQNPDHPLTLFGGHISADPDLTHAKSNDITPHLYFFMVKNRRTADKQRIIFWFNGGPGCSSFDGLMMEVGPWRWDGKSDHDWYVKEGGWEEYATVVYVDQPAGTGFSYTSTEKYVHTMEEAQKQFLTFLTNFYKTFPEYQHVDTYFAGESFAGQWIPYYADAVLNSTLAVPLRGLAIGNPWMDSRRQYPAYLEFAVRTGLIQENTDPWKAVKKEVDACAAELEKIQNNPMSIVACTHIIRSVMSVRERKIKGQEMCINIYDIRLDDTSPACGMNWPPEMPHITKLLARPEVVSALHASAHPGNWVECRGTIHSAFHEKDLESSITVLPRVLSKLEVLIFAGDQDLICNYVGLESMIKALTWNGGTGLGTVQTQSWSVNNAPAGTWVASRNLTYAKIFNASHMAPFDVPHVTHDMMLRFMNVNFSSLIGGSANIPSSLGTSAKPIFVGQEDVKPTNLPPAKSPEQDKAMWEAYYNAGSAALVLILVFALIGTFLWCRARRNRVKLPLDNSRRMDEEESIPLNSATRRDEELDDMRQRGTKAGGSSTGGPSRSMPEPIFEVGDSEEEEDYRRASVTIPR